MRRTLDEGYCGGWTSGDSNSVQDLLWHRFPAHFHDNRMSPFYWQLSSKVTEAHSTESGRVAGIHVNCVRSQSSQNRSFELRPPRRPSGCRRATVQRLTMRRTHAEGRLQVRSLCKVQPKRMISAGSKIYSVGVWT